MFVFFRKRIYDTNMTNDENKFADSLNHEANPIVEDLTSDDSKSLEDTNDSMNSIDSIYSNSSNTSSIFGEVL